MKNVIRKSFSLVTAATLTLSIGLANANDDSFKNMPELVADDRNEATTLNASTSMKCYVDTAAFDHFSNGFCFAASWNRTTTAVFRIDGGPSTNFRIYWSDSRCSQTSKTCMLPISWYQRINLSADILDLSNGTFSSASATAMYEGLH
ncbi:hypothetical protein [Pleionea sp. CnH1-48]|uniref:hypothetical protein n=1 Tax=Pleionea sp. CnH1-48 TaxID=2954494 RepID=UPI002097D91D|nr:hypothetical protein [Pleionea sp. CnH1-48]MCO7224183.1 hypothetical protein [Pleionea sp. CnH1-48]